MTVDRFLHSYNSQIKNIINLGCGTGKHDIELARPGYRCKGIDMSPLMIEIASPNMKDKENVVDVNYEVLIINKESSKVQTIKETHKMRYFFRPELEFLLKKAGFELVDNMDCQTLGETGYDSWTSYFLAETI